MDEMPGMIRPDLQALPQVKEDVYKRQVHGRHTHRKRSKNAKDVE